MNEVLNQFDTIIFDMNNTFVFGGDRFSLSENYFATYQQCGGRILDARQVNRAIREVHGRLEPIYIDPTRHDGFPSLRETIETLPESHRLSAAELERLVDVFAIHERGTISTEYIEVLKSLDATHELHLVSNVWSPRKRFIELLQKADVERCFKSVVFSSDSRSVKPSTILFTPLLPSIDVNRTVFIGDCLRCDIAAANRMGMKSIWVSHGRSKSECGPQPDYVVTDLLSMARGQYVQSFVPTFARMMNSVKKQPIRIENEAIRLRSTKESDLGFVLATEIDPENSLSIVNWPVSQHQASLADNDIAHLIIEETNSESPVGFMILRGIDQSSGPLEMQRLVIADDGKEYALQSLGLLKQYVFDRLERRRLWLNVLPIHTQARALYLAAGFRYEGTWRDSFEVDHGFMDVELMAALSTDEQESPSLDVHGRRYTVVRTLSEKHVQQFCEMYDIEWPSETRTHEDLRRAMCGSEIVVGLVEECSNDLVGFCRIVTDRGFRAWIYGLCVREDRRGFGLGRVIVDEILASNQLVGIHSVSLTCAPRMIEFYGKWGFHVFEDEAVMNLSLR